MSEQRQSGFGYYLGVDGGGTKTKFTLCRVGETHDAPSGEKAPARGAATATTGEAPALYGENAPARGASALSGAAASADPFGEIIGEYTSSCCHYLQIGFDGVEKLIRDGVTRVCRAVRENPAAGLPDFSPSDINRAFFGMAGYADVAADDPKIEAAVRAALSGLSCDGGAAGDGSAAGDSGSAGAVCDVDAAGDSGSAGVLPFPFGIGNDCENALAGALAGKPGINVIAGTGSVGCGRDGRGGYYRCGGWNHALGGDEGSAFWIAWNLLHVFQRQSDGRAERTALYSAVREALSLSTDDALVTRVVEEWKLDRTRIASLAPIVSSLAADGDPSAKAILDDAARQLADYAIAIREKLDFDGEIPVSGTGGIFSIGPLLTDEFGRILRVHGMHFVQPLYTPDLGAVLLAIGG